MLGSDKAAIEHAITQTRGTAGVLSVPVTLAMTSGKLSVNVPAGAEDRAEVWLCPMTKAITVVIGRGENHGRTITYHNVVRRWVKLGDWTGKVASWNVPLTDFAAKDIDKVAVLVQRGAATSPGLVLGAAMVASSDVGLPGLTFEPISRRFVHSLAKPAPSAECPATSAWRAAPVRPFASPSFGRGRSRAPLSALPRKRHSGIEPFRFPRRLTL